MSSSPSSRRHGGTVAPPSPPPAPGSLPAAEARDWASLPRDIVLDIFHRLGPREIMLGAEFACKPWRTVALEEPSLWRRVGMESAAENHWRHRSSSMVMAMKLVALDRAAGQCEAFHGVSHGDYLLDLVERAPSLKCLHINEHYSDDESGDDVVQAVMKLPLLEELLVYFKHSIEDRDENMLQSICKACPDLKKLILIYDSFLDGELFSKEPIDGEIPMMLKLHTLVLSDCDLDVDGLKAILDSCPALETLHINGYFDRRGMDKKLRKKCARVKNLTLPPRISDDEYYFD